MASTVFEAKRGVMESDIIVGIAGKGQYDWALATDCQIAGALVCDWAVAITISEPIFLFFDSSLIAAS